MSFYSIVVSQQGTANHLQGLRESIPAEGEIFFSLNLKGPYQVHLFLPLKMSEIKFVLTFKLSSSGLS